VVDGLDVGQDFAQEEGLSGLADPALLFVALFQGEDGVGALADGGA